jgi:hypothetical protein
VHYPSLTHAFLGLLLHPWLWGPICLVYNFLDHTLNPATSISHAVFLTQKFLFSHICLSKLFSSFKSQIRCCFFFKTFPLMPSRRVLFLLQIFMILNFCVSYTLFHWHAICICVLFTVMYDKLLHAREFHLASLSSHYSI